MKNNPELKSSIFKKIVEFCPFAFIVWQIPENDNRAENIILAYANEKADKVGLKTITDKFGQTMRELFPTAILSPDEHNFPKTVVRVNKTGQTERMNELRYIYEGKLFFYDIHVIPIEENYILAIFNNITEQTQKNLELSEHIRSSMTTLKLRTQLEET